MSEAPTYVNGSWIDAAIHSASNVYDDGRSVQALALAELSALRARVAELEKALKRYGNHTEDCDDQAASDHWANELFACICGFDSTMAALGLSQTTPTKVGDS